MGAEWQELLVYDSYDARKSGYIHSDDSAADAEYSSWEEELAARKAFEKAVGEFGSLRVCPYCTSLVKLHHISETYEGYVPQIGVSRTVHLCHACGFWAARHGTDGRVGALGGSSETVTALAVQRRYAIDAPEVPLAEIRCYLERTPEAVRGVHPHVLERIVGDCFRSNWGCVDVIHVGRPCDGGVDVVLVMSDGGRWLVQVKRRQNATAVEGVTTVRNLLGTLVSEGELRGVVVSTADHFSHFARKLCSCPNVIEKGYEIRLVDRGVLKEMLVRNAPADMEPLPWRQFLWQCDRSQLMSERDPQLLSDALFERTDEGDISLGHGPLSYLEHASDE